MKPRWIPYDPDDAAWTPDLSPDKTGSERWTGASGGDLVNVSPVQIHGVRHWLPGVFLHGVTFGGGTGWLHTERAWSTVGVAKKEAVEEYAVNVAALERRGLRVRAKEPL